MLQFPCQQLNLKAEIALPTTASWVASIFSSATGQSGECGNQLYTATICSAEFVSRANHNSVHLGVSLTASASLGYLKVRRKSELWFGSFLQAWSCPESKLPLLLWLCWCGNCGKWQKKPLSFCSVSPVFGNY